MIKTHQIFHKDNLIPLVQLVRALARARADAPVCREGRTGTRPIGTEGPHTRPRRHDQRSYLHPDFTFSRVKPRTRTRGAAGRTA